VKLLYCMGPCHCDQGCIILPVLCPCSNPLSLYRHKVAVPCVPLTVRELHREVGGSLGPYPRKAFVYFSSGMSLLRRSFMPRQSV